MGAGGKAKNGVKQQKQITPAGSPHVSIIFPPFSSTAEPRPRIGNWWWLREIWVDIREL